MLIEKTLGIFLLNVYGLVHKVQVLGVLMTKIVSEREGTCRSSTAHLMGGIHWEKPSQAIGSGEEMDGDDVCSSSSSWKEGVDFKGYYLQGIPLEPSGDWYFSRGQMGAIWPLLRRSTGFWHVKVWFQTEYKNVLKWELTWTKKTLAIYLASRFNDT